MATVGHPGSFLFRQVSPAHIVATAGPCLARIDATRQLKTPPHLAETTLGADRASLLLNRFLTPAPGPARRRHRFQCRHRRAPCRAIRHPPSRHRGLRTRRAASGRSWPPRPLLGHRLHEDALKHRVERRVPRRIMLGEAPDSFLTRRLSQPFVAAACQCVARIVHAGHAPVCRLLPFLGKKYRLALSAISDRLPWAGSV